MHMAGGDAQGGEGGCTCILCIPTGYAPVHCTKRFAVFPSQDGISLTKLPLAGNNLIISGQGEVGK
jgi:hypothetical protein